MKVDNKIKISTMINTDEKDVIFSLFLFLFSLGFLVSI